MGKNEMWDVPWPGRHGVRRYTTHDPAPLNPAIPSGICTMNITIETQTKRTGVDIQQAIEQFLQGGRLKKLSRRLRRKT